MRNIRILSGLSIRATICVVVWQAVGVLSWAQDQRPFSEVLVEVTRGPIVESRHHGRLVAVATDGKVVFSVGDSNELIFPRSSLKPFQALATVMLAQEHGVDLSSKEIAMICASHEGHDYQVEVVAALLQRVGAEEGHLYCGANKGSRLANNCSGKHSGMLLQAKLSGDSLDGYWQIDHPVQKRIRQAIQEFTGYSETLQWGWDGCGVPNYALPLYNLALGYARLCNPDAAPEKYRAAARAIRDAMQAHPELISSRDSFDAKLIASAAGHLVGKTGAEACYGLGLTQPSVGLAVKIEDGNPRGMPCVLLSALDRLKAMTPEIDKAVGSNRFIDQTNTVGIVIGQIRAAPAIASAASNGTQPVSER